jgi:hypothetical protein
MGNLFAMRIYLIAVVACAAVVVLAGCGSSAGAGSTNASKSSALPIATQIEQICVRRNGTISAAHSRVTNESTAEDSARVRASAERSSLAELDELIVPASYQPGWRAFLTYKQALIKAWSLLGEKGLGYHKGEALTDADEAEHKMLATARSLGFKECAQVN